MAATTPNETNDAPTADGDETSRSKKNFYFMGGGLDWDWIQLGLGPSFAQKFGVGNDGAK